MEYKELSSISASLESYTPFGLSRTESRNIFCALSRSKAQVLELSYQHHHEGSIRFIQTAAPCPTHIPSQDVEKNWNVIYDRAERRHRNEIQLNPLLVPEILAQTELTFALTVAKFAPPLLNRKGLHLACLSNYGGCDIVFKNFTERTWKVVCCLSKIWTEHRLPKYPKKIEEYVGLTNYVADTQLTALSWSSDISEDELQLCVISAAGTVAFIQLKIEAEQDDMAASVQFEKDIGLRKVNLLEFITFVDKQMKRHSFLIAGDLVGNVALYRVCIAAEENVNDLVEVAYLWSDGDRIRADGLKWTFDVRTEAFTVLYCKGPHVFCHLLTITGKPLSHCIQHVHGLFITSTLFVTLLFFPCSLIQFSLLLCRHSSSDFDNVSNRNPWWPHNTYQFRDKKQNNSYKWDAHSTGDQFIEVRPVWISRFHQQRISNVCTLYQRGIVIARLNPNTLISLIISFLSRFLFIRCLFLLFHHSHTTISSTASPPPY